MVSRVEGGEGRDTWSAGLVGADRKSDKPAISAGNNPNGLVMTLIQSFEIHGSKTLIQASG